MVSCVQEWSRSWIHLSGKTAHIQFKVLQTVLFDLIRVVALHIEKTPDKKSLSGNKLGFFT